jgi:hypothetical protein
MTIEEFLSPPKRRFAFLRWVLREVWYRGFYWPRFCIRYWFRHGEWLGLSVDHTGVEGRDDKW